MGSGKTGHFQRYKAFMHNGWPAFLTKGEASLWHAYNQHANHEDKAWPNAETLAGMIGHKSIAHVGEYRKKLVGYGLLEVVEKGGFKSHKWVVKLLVPGTPPNGSKGSQIGNQSDAQRFPIRCAKVPNSVSKGSRSGEAVYIEEQTNEQINEQESQAASPPASAGRDPVVIGEPEPTPPRPADPAPKPPPYRAEDAEVPPELDTPEFREQWAAWCAHRRAKRATLTERAVTLQLRDMVKHGVGAAVDAMAASERQGWTGVFPEKHVARQPAESRQERSRRQTREALVEWANREPDEQGRIDTFGGLDKGPVPLPDRRAGVGPGRDVPARRLLAHGPGDQAARG